MYIAQTNRLNICLLSVNDTAFIIELLNSPGWLQYIGDRGIKTTKDALAYLTDGPIASYEKNNFGLWMVKFKDSDTPIGMCGLIQRDYLPHPDIGFAFLPQYEGQGFAYEAATAVVSYATRVLKQTDLAAITLANNAASLNLLHKLGFAYKKMITPPNSKEELMLLEKQLATTS